MFSGIVHPEVVTLGVGIGSVKAADSLHLVQQGTISQNGQAQLSPIPPSTARNDIVDRCEGEALKVEVAMKHG